MQSIHHVVDLDANINCRLKSSEFINIWACLILPKQRWLVRGQSRNNPKLSRLPATIALTDLATLEPKGIRSQAVSGRPRGPARNLQASA